MSKGIKPDELVHACHELEKSFGDQLSNDDLRKLVDIYIAALDSYDRDIMDSISFYVQEYGVDDTKKYIIGKIKECNDKYLNQEMNYLMEIIK